MEKDSKKKVNTKKLLWFLIVPISLALLIPPFSPREEIVQDRSSPPIIIQQMQSSSLETQKADLVKKIREVSEELISLQYKLLQIEDETKNMKP